MTFIDKLQETFSLDMEQYFEKYTQDLAEQLADMEQELLNLKALLANLYLNYKKEYGYSFVASYIYAITHSEALFHFSSKHQLTLDIEEKIQLVNREREQELLTYIEILKKQPSWKKYTPSLQIHKFCQYHYWQEELERICTYSKLLSQAKDDSFVEILLQNFKTRREEIFLAKILLEKYLL